MLLWFGFVATARAVWSPETEFARLFPEALKWSGERRIAIEVNRSVWQLPRASTAQEAIERVRSVLRWPNLFVICYEGRVYVSETHHAKDKHKIHYMLSMLVSMQPLRNFAATWDQGARGTGCPTDATVPCFVIAKKSGYAARGVLVPNPYFAHVGAWDELRAQVSAAADARPFEARDPRAFWRGTVTASCNPGNIARLGLLSVADESFDVECVACEPPSVETCAEHYTPAMRRVVQTVASTDRSDFIAPINFSRWQVVLNMPGTKGGSYSRNLNYLWLLRSAVLLWNSHAVEWYYPALRDGLTHQAVDVHTVADVVKRVERRSLAAMAKTVSDDYICGSCLRRYWESVVASLRHRLGFEVAIDDASNFATAFPADFDCSSLREFVLTPHESHRSYFGGHPGTLRALDDTDALRVLCLARKTTT